MVILKINRIVVVFFGILGYISNCKKLYIMKKLIITCALVVFSCSILFAGQIDTTAAVTSAQVTVVPTVKLNKLQGVKPKTTNNWSKIKDLFL